MLRRAVIALGPGLLAMSACSSGGADSAGPADGVGEVATTIDAGSNGTVGGAGGSDAEFCAAISAIQSAEFELEETFGADARQLFSDVQESAPAEIADDVATVIATLDAVAGLGISMDESDPEAVDAAVEILLDPDYTDANERLSDYTSESCGIDLGDGDETDVDLGELEASDDI